MSEDKDWSTEIDSKYRLVLLAARRAKQLSKGAKPKVAAKARRNERGIKSLGVPGTIEISRIRSAIREVAEETLEEQ